MESGNPIGLVVVLLAFCAVVIIVGWQLAYHGTPVERWAKANGFKLISEEREVFASVRILGMPERTSQVFRIVVRDREGRIRSGRIDWGGRPLDKMHVRWDA